MNFPWRHPEEKESKSLFVARGEAPDGRDEASRLGPLLWDRSLAPHCDSSPEGGGQDGTVISVSGSDYLHIIFLELLNRYFIQFRLSHSPPPPPSTDLRPIPALLIVSDSGRTSTEWTMTTLDSPASWSFASSSVPELINVFGFSDSRLSPSVDG